jgi:hypothetical protein
MKAYLMTTGALFALIPLAHLLRIMDEWPDRATDPWFLLLTVATTALALWAWRLLRRQARS